MSDIVHILPDSVANQIAAGEVIQRPASIVKELVENAIDAGSRSVQVQVQDAGRTLVQVIDDGRGMSPKDAVACFARHATSKIQEASDLFALRTMGFRGEALASIAAVAEVELRTAQSGQETGTRVMMAASTLQSSEPVACPSGCNFSVRNLFFNIPARRKFLKSNATELNWVIQEFQRIALAHEDLEMRLFSDGCEILNLPPQNLRNRIAGLVGRKVSDQLLPLEVDTSLVRLKGFVGKPESAHRKGVSQYFFVNGRFMRHPYFHKAVQQAFDQLVPQGEQVPYFIYLEVDPASIDVNIHPTKTEIKFDNEQAIWKILLSAIREALGRFSAVPMLDFDAEDRPSEMPVFNPRAEVTQPRLQVDPGYSPFGSEDRSTYSRSGSSGSGLCGSGCDSWDELDQRLSQAPGGDAFIGEPGRIPSRAQNEAPLSFGDVETEWENASKKAPEPFLSADEGLETDLLQVMGRYILRQTDQGLLFVDQHRAHIRVLYERFLENAINRHAVTQGLLFPQVLELPPSLAAVMTDILPQVEAAGFELSSLGPGSWAIQGIPAGLEGMDHVAMLEEMVQESLEQTSQTMEAVRSRVAISMARRCAIPYGQALSRKEMMDLLGKLAATSAPSRTPSGKPVSFILGKDDMDRLLQRQ